jgi:hypothetical protein
MLLRRNNSDLLETMSFAWSRGLVRSYLGMEEVESGFDAADRNKTVFIG